MTPSTSIPYRPDIDGLRAIAVLVVVFFHADVPWISGGYVGVDVFFVISGYLITSLIVSAQDKGKFSLAWFYERRIRRIFPALFVVLLACAIVGWVVMIPGSYKNLGDSILATALFSSNVLFWWRSGYCQTDAESQPLLHTWSLAVEEQFYLGFPLLLMFLKRFGKETLLRIIGILACVSFISCSILVYVWPISAFYLAPFRAWELLLGSLLVLGAFPSIRRTDFRNYCSAIGLAMILAAAFLYSKETPFPGISALLPAGGTALIIWVGIDEQPATNRLLASKPLVFSGKISYSLYLWHYVVLAFGSYLSVGKMPTLRVVILLALSTVLAWLSWLLIEQPVRRAKFRLSEGRSLFAVTALAITCLALAGWTIRVEKGFETRTSADQLAVLGEITKTEQESGDCLMMAGVFTAKAHLFCKLGTADLPEPSFFVWGDSHAKALHPVLDSLAKKQHTAGLLASAGGCPPLIDVMRKEPAELDCVGINQKILEFITSQSSIRNVILVGRWASYVEATSYKEQPTNLYNPKHVLLANRSLPEGASTQEMMMAGFEKTISALLAAKKRVWIVGPIPEIEVNVSKALYLRSFGIGGNGIEPTREDFNRRQSHVVSILKTLALRYPVSVLWPHMILCNEKNCMVESEGKPLYLDTNHLSYSGANFIEPIFASVQLR